MPKISYTFTTHVEMEQTKAQELTAKVKALGHSSLAAFVKNQLDKAFFALDVADPDPGSLDRLNLGSNGTGHERWMDEIDISLDEEG